MSLILPSLQEVKRHIKSELRRIESRGYSAEEILACVHLYVNRASAYETLIQQFSTRIQSAPAIADYVHSVRFRLKDPFHLADKLVRKCLDDKRPRNITQDKSDAQLFQVVTVGVQTMPPYGLQLSRDDRWKVVLHIRSFKRPTPQ